MFPLTFAAARAAWYAARSDICVSRVRRGAVLWSTFPLATPLNSAADSRHQQQVQPDWPSMPSAAAKANKSMEQYTSVSNTTASFASAAGTFSLKPKHKAPARTPRQKPPKHTSSAWLFSASLAAPLSAGDLPVAFIYPLNSSASSAAKLTTGSVAAIATVCFGTMQ